VTRRYDMICSRRLYTLCTDGIS